MSPTLDQLQFIITVLSAAVLIGAITVTAHIHKEWKENKKNRYKKMFNL